jgi:macrolide transport system ATP-binding/permease protein
MKFMDLFPWRRDRRAELLREEIAAHIRMDAETRVARGETAGDAALNARRDFGNAALVHELTRDTWGGLWLERLWQDLRFGARMLRRAPAFTVVAVACLTLGIAANAVVLSWMEGILLRPYPGVAQQDRLVAVAGTARGTSGFDSMSWPDFMDLSRGTTSFSAFIASKITGATLTGSDRADRLAGLLVSANYFDALGVRPARGRGFLPGEDVGANTHPVTVIGYRFWRDRFRGDPNIVGKTIGLNGIPHTIVGVAPEEFLGTFVGYTIQFWLPASQQRVVDPTGYKLDDRRARWIEGFARLKPGVTLAQAQSEIGAAAKRLEADYPNDDRGRGVTILPLWNAPFDGAKELLPMLRVALIVAIFVLAIACANVANLLLVRSLSRRHEMTVRLAIGAGRERLVRQLVTECAILAVLATLGGLAVAYWARGVLTYLLGDAGGNSVTFAGALDWRVATLGVAIGLGSVFLFGLAPALQASNVDLAPALKADARSSVGNTGGRGRLRDGLVMLQVSSSFVLLVGAGLLLISLRRLRSESPGFATDNVVATAVNLFASSYDTARAKQFDAELLRRVSALPAVEGAALARSTPFSKRPYDRAALEVDGYHPARDELPTVDYNQVTPGYFAVLGIPLASGRDFAAADDDRVAPVAIVSEAAAAKYWPSAEPVGKRLKLGARWMRVVGVARDIRHRSILEAPASIVYVPFAQNVSTVAGLFVRTSHGVAAIAPEIIREERAIDPNVAAYEVLTMREQIDRSTYGQRIAVTLVGLFGALALGLAAIGLFGVVAFAVSQSTREFGLRLALGASPSKLLVLVLTWGLRLTATGLVLGVALAFGMTRLLGDLLYKVSPRDPTAFSAALLVMTVATAGACLVPALRVVRLDAMRALRG